MHPIAEWGRQRFGVDEPADRRLAEKGWVCRFMTHPPTPCASCMGQGKSLAFVMGRRWPTGQRYLYLVQPNDRAIRYGIGVGRIGFQWSGIERVSQKQEWPDWRAPPEMVGRQPYLPRFMAGGPGNPLGARALYLGHSVFRIHGTTSRRRSGTPFRQYQLEARIDPRCAHIKTTSRRTSQAYARDHLSRCR